MSGMAGRSRADREQKIVVVGSGGGSRMSLEAYQAVVEVPGVGKTALTIRFVTTQFYDQGYNPTIEDSYRKQFVVDDEAVTLEILDTAGQEEYAAMADQWYKFGAGFMLVYSITDRPTYDAIRGFHQDILRVKDRSYIPCVVVSNKCDLARLRAVSQHEGRNLSKTLSAPFIECSARDGVNVDIAFRELVKLVRKDEKRMAVAASRILAGPLAGPHASEADLYADQYRDRTRERGRDGGMKKGGQRKYHSTGTGIDERCRCIVM